MTIQEIVAAAYPHLRLYVGEQEVWDAAKCKRYASRVISDGLGTPYPYKGGLYTGYEGYGVTLYNGGCTRDGEHYHGIYLPTPKLAEGYEIVQVPTWGYRIRKIDGDDPSPSYRGTPVSYPTSPP